MTETCGDNRFEIMKSAKRRLCIATNIEDSPNEWAVIDSILFRMWQMGWLPGCERAKCKGCKCEHMKHETLCPGCSGDKRDKPTKVVG